MSAVRLSPLDAAWLFTESRATPNHVGGLLQFKLPPDAPRDYMRALMADFRSHRNFTAPWNRRLKLAFAMNPVPAWIEDDDIDLEYHVRHAALPWPGGERELGELVGRLHSTPLDLSRPPWECTIIEGLDGGRFALFIKMHHSLIDGVSGMKLLQRAMAGDPAKSLALPPFWAGGPAVARRARAARSGRCRRWPTPPRGGAGTERAGRSVPQLVTAFGKMLRRIGDPGEGMMVPFDAPQSVLNGRVREKRRFATQQFEMARLRALAEAADCTLNDVVLALCGGALRRFLPSAAPCPTSR
jgi:diacylglycerol O-acyltransferase